MHTTETLADFKQEASTLEDLFVFLSSLTYKQRKETLVGIMTPDGVIATDGYKRGDMTYDGGIVTIGDSNGCYRPIVVNQDEHDGEIVKVFMLGGDE